ncbi:MAG TPA: HlyD family efflux transporter periplasmic adaptor subunit [Terriglobia bacterium]|nr:HlyD family efflux transporter periplasmic adaptor subunit [Terriglobia bacterium]
MTRRGTFRGLLAVAVLVAAVFGVRASLKALDTVKPLAVPVARVSRGTLNMNVYATGEMQPVRRVMVIAPPVGGGTLQILHVARTGTLVKAGEVVVEFDPSEQRFNLEQARSDLAQGEQEIAKARADAAVLAAQDQVALLKARFDVRQAELDVSKNELLSAIDAKKNLLKLEEAKRVLAQLEHDTQTHAASSQATMAVSEEKRHKAQLAMQQAQQNIDNMQVKSPIAGVVRVRENERASGGMFFTGMTLPEFRDGDQVFPGGLIAEVLDTGQMELSAKINESDRTNLKPGQQVQVRVDALPDEALGATVKSVAATASRGEWWSSDSSEKFAAVFQLDHPGTRLRPGFTAGLTILSGEIRAAVLVPRQAVFVKEGKPVVYVKSGTGFVPTEVHIRAVNESRAAVDGLKDGEEVALVNPQAQPSSGAAAAASAPSLPRNDGGSP